MTPVCEIATPSRRALLVSGGALFASARLPRLASAAGARDPRLIVIILRGALDGLATVAPVGDPDYASLHGDIALSLAGPNAAVPLDGFFALHPAMPVFARLYKAGQALVVHAAATSYRERSHFDGQDVLESGLAGPGAVSSGWLNRALAALPSGDTIAPDKDKTMAKALAVGAAAPLILRGAAPVLGWAPQTLAAAGGDLAARVLDLYTHRDPALAQALRLGLDTDRIAARQGMGGDRAKGGGDAAVMRQSAAGAARLMAAVDGPRIAAMAFDGWDTHAQEGGATGRLAMLLGGLDGAFAALEAGLGAAWADTAVVVVTEFGRTARVNGTVGTDHGTGTLALLAGGAVKGGRVIADWPGLKPAQLHEGRDLRPTTDLRAVLKGLLAGQFGLPESALATMVFPESGTVAAMAGLVG